MNKTNRHPNISIKNRFALNWTKMDTLIDEATTNVDTKFQVNQHMVTNFWTIQLLGTIHGIGTDFGTFAMATASLLMVV